MRHETWRHCDRLPLPPPARPARRMICRRSSECQKGGRNASTANHRDAPCCVSMSPELPLQRGASVSCADHAGAAIDRGRPPEVVTLHTLRANPLRMSIGGVNTAGLRSGTWACGGIRKASSILPFASLGTMAPVSSRRWSEGAGIQSRRPGVSYSWTIPRRLLCEYVAVRGRVGHLPSA